MSAYRIKLRIQVEKYSPEGDSWQKHGDQNYLVSTHENSESAKQCFSELVDQLKAELNLPEE